MKIQNERTQNEPTNDKIANELMALVDSMKASLFTENLLVFKRLTVKKVSNQKKELVYVNARCFEL